MLKKEEEAINEMADIRSLNKFRKNVGVTNPVLEHQINANKFSANAKYLQETYLLNTLSEVFFNALPLDEDYKINNKFGLTKLFKAELAKLAESSDVLLKKMSMSESSYLRELSEKVKSEASKDAININKKDDTSVDKDTKCVDHQDSDEAAEAIKDKVIKVIKKENEISEKEKSIQDELDKAQQCNESATIIKKGTAPRQYGLFKALMINSYKEALHEAKLEESSMLIDKSEDSVSINKDNLLAEAVIKYTILE
ncbi:hypothetical protein V6O07_23895, partial [Arthrospira platensis SPKY2]